MNNRIIKRTADLNPNTMENSRTPGLNPNTMESSRTAGLISKIRENNFKKINILKIRQINMKIKNINKSKIIKKTMITNKKASSNDKITIKGLTKMKDNLNKKGKIKNIFNKRIQ